MSAFLKMIAAVALVLSTAPALAQSANQARPAADPAAALASLHQAIDALPCVEFEWEKSEGTEGSAHGAIKIPVQIDGRNYSFQLDTGSDFSMIYGKEAQDRGWARPGDKFARVSNIRIGTRVIEPTLFMVRGDWPTGGGLIGMDVLMNHYTIIDYPRRRLCLVAPVDMPRALLDRASFAWASIRGTKLYVPMTLDGRRVNNIVFDSGASASYLNLEQAAWKEVTGIADLGQAPRQFETRTWNGLERMVSGPVRGKLQIAGVDLNIPSVDTWRDRPTYYGQFFPTPTNGLFGNASLLDQIIVLDLTPAARFGIFR